MRRKLGITAMQLRLLAMILMLLAHLWATVIPGNDWMTYAGRMAMPIFAFQIAEGYCHTSNVKKYRNRLLLFALLSEIPFDLVMGGGVFFPYHQNVMFTLLLGLWACAVLDKAKRKGPAGGWLKGALMALLICLIGLLTLVDYGFMGISMVILFFLLRDFPLARAAQLIAMVLLNIVFFEGQSLVLLLGGREIFFPVQGFAVLALVPIWLYNGEKGRGGKAAQYAAYAFYPLHLLAIALAARLL